MLDSQRIPPFKSYLAAHFRIAPGLQQPRPERHRS